jgi:hypothetical protein
MPTDRDQIERCPDCDGTGELAKSYEALCHGCNGSGKRSPKEALEVALARIAELEAPVEESDPVAIAYGAPPVDERLDERFRIVAWLRQLDAVSRWGRRSVSVVTVAELMTAMADAIARGEHEVKK